MKDEVMQLLGARGVTLSEIAELALALQKPYSADLTLADCLKAVEAVVQKREVQYAILTGITLDTLAEKGLLDGALGEAIRKDEPLFGIDEVLALSIASIYGTVGSTSFGYLDKRKPGIIGRLDTKYGQQVHTFLDDLVAGVAAAASARIAHRHNGEPGLSPAVGR